MRYKNLSIRAKLLTGFMVLSLIITTGGLLNIIQSNTVRQITFELGLLHPLENLNQSMAYDANAYLLGHNEYRAKFLNHRKTFNNLLEQFGIAHGNHIDHESPFLDKMVGTLTGTTPDPISIDDDSFSRLVANSDTYFNQALALFDLKGRLDYLSSTGRETEVTRLEVERLWQSLNLLNEDMSLLLTQLIDTHNQKTEDAEERSVQLVMATTLISLAAATLMGIFISATISRPIIALRQALTNVGRGSFATRAQHEGSDEVGQLSIAFNDMLENLNSITVSKQYMDNIINSMSETLLVTDTHGTIRMINTASSHLLNYDAHELIGAHINKVMGYNSNCDLMFKEIFENGTIPSFEKHYITKYGKFIPMLCSASVMQDSNNHITGVICVGLDLTDRKHMDRVKAEFVSTVSHELRTPLTSIHGALGLISGGAIGEVPANMAPLLEIANNNTSRLLRLIDDILDIEKIEAGAMELQMRAQNLLPLLQKTIANNQTYAEQYKTQFVLEEPKFEEVIVKVDGHRLVQVISNLLANAAKFSDHREPVKIKVSLQGEYVRVAITNTGPGIPVEFQDRIFQRFAQADSSDSRRNGGTGLGLSICKAIIDRHGGHINFESAPGEYTTFYFDLPEYVDRSLFN